MSARILRGCAAMLLASAIVVQASERLTIPDVPDGVQRPITPDDHAHLRRIEVLSLSPDRGRFAVLVRQADPQANEYRSAWFIGSVHGDGALTYVGDGGDTRLARNPHGSVTIGSLERPTVRWSPDSRWIAYTLVRDGAVQLWRSLADGGVQEQITHNASDVGHFEWSEDGKSIYYTVGTPRAEQQERLQERERVGYRYDADLDAFTDFMLPQMPLAPSTRSTTWIVRVADGRERLASDAEQEAFARARGVADPTRGEVGGAIRTGVSAQAIRPDGARAWLERSKYDTSSMRVKASFQGSSQDGVECAAVECSGFIERLWWIDQHTVLFWRREGTGLASQGIYTWAPASGAVKTVLRAPNDYLLQCDLATGGRLVCVRETATLPSHLAVIDTNSPTVRVLADVNPEFRNIRLGKVERFEWNTPEFGWSEPGQPLHGLYAERAYGYIYYPPDFDATRKYPVYINPYAANGFENATTQETPNHVFAARGMVVLNTSFPLVVRNVFTGPGVDLLKLGYSPELDFPHLSMYAESTLRALDAVVARGFVDERRIGIGGVSHGTFVPLFMVQKHDRMAAVSISSGTWSRLVYYLPTGIVRNRGGAVSWAVKPEGSGLELWRRLDLADNVDTIEAPILMNVPAYEMPTLLRLVNHMAEAGKPYDAYVFSGETHMKWQPAHLHAIVQRNLDWFEFWLQDREDPDPAKADQYARWRELKARQQAQRTSAAQEP